MQLVVGDFTILTTPANNPNYPPFAVIEALLKEGGFQDRANYFGWFRYVAGVGPIPHKVNYV